jgi:hypothetical protein
MAVMEEKGEKETEEEEPNDLVAEGVWERPTLVLIQREEEFYSHSLVWVQQQPVPKA